MHVATTVPMLFLYVSLLVLLSALGETQRTDVSRWRKSGHRKLTKRLAVSDRYEYELGTCLDTFDANENTIIRTQESRVLGAKFINVTEVGSKEDCLKLCCETNSCNVIVFEEKNAGSCYLFDCGSPDDFRCKFAGHDHYTSAILSVNRHTLDLDRWSDQSKHEQELTNLRIKERIEAPKTTLLPVPHTTSTPVKEVPVINVATKTTLAVRRCNPYQFECRSNGECLAIYNACDGIPQCSDGSDEGPELGCPNNPDLTSSPVLTSAPAPGLINPESVPLPRPVPHLRLLPSSASKEGPLNPHETYILAQQPKPQQQSSQAPPHLLPRPVQQHLPPTQPQQQQPQQPPIQQPYGSPLQQQHLASPQQMQPKPAPQQAFKYPNHSPQQQLPQPMQGAEGRRRPVPQLPPPPPPQQQRPQLEQRPPSQYLNRERVIPTALEDQWANYQRQQPSMLEQPRGYGPAYDDQGSHIFNHKHSGLMEGGFRFNPYETKHASPLGASSSSGAASHEGPAQDQFNLNGNYERLSGDGYMGAATNGNANYNFFNPRPAAASWSRPSSDNNQGSQREGGTGETLYHNGNHMSKMALANNYPHPEPQYELTPLDYYDDETGTNRGTGYYNSHMPAIRPIDGQKSAVPEHKIHVPYDKQDAGRKAPFKEAAKQEYHQAQQESKKVPQTEPPPAVTANGDTATTPKGPEEHTHSHAHSHAGKKQKADDIVTTSKVPKPVQHHAGISQLHVSLAQVEVETAEASQSSGAVLALTLGLSITAILLVLVGCRLRAVRRRLLRHGRSPYAHDADYLVNGMYL